MSDIVYKQIIKAVDDVLFLYKRFTLFSLVSSHDLSTNLEQMKILSIGYR